MWVIATTKREPVYVNMAQITGMQRLGGMTSIYSVAGEILRVDQDPERLLARSGMPYRDATKDFDPGKLEKPFGEG
jgi:hypothetical protein